MHKGHRVETSKPKRTISNGPFSNNIKDYNLIFKIKQLEKDLDNKKQHMKAMAREISDKGIENRRL